MDDGCGAFANSYFTRKPSDAVSPAPRSVTAMFADPTDLDVVSVLLINGTLSVSTLPVSANVFGATVIGTVTGVVWTPATCPMM
jgi:cytochrome c biogenesis protein CcdA